MFKSFKSKVKLIIVLLWNFLLICQLFRCKYETENKNWLEKGEMEGFDFISSLF